MIMKSSKITTPVKARRPVLMDHWYSYNFKRMSKENPKLTPQQIDDLVKAKWSKNFGAYVPISYNINKFK